MPIYEYICEECGQKYDKLVRSSTANVELACPKCGSDRGRKAFSAFSAHGSSSAGSFSSGSDCGPVG